MPPPLGRLVFLLVFLASSSLAAPLQVVIDKAKGAVAHVSILSRDGQEIRSGSGFVVAAEGRFVTDFHVVQDAPRILVIFEGGRQVSVLGVLAFDVVADLAVLQLEQRDAPALELSLTEPQQGDPVVVIGSPKGFSGSVSTGIVSAVRSAGIARDKQDPDGYSENSWQLQITAATSPGSSGSPILSEQGQVVGVAVGKYSGEALNFGVPVSMLRQVLAEVREPQPLSVLKTGRSLGTNLLISVLVVLSLAGLFFFASWLVRWLARHRTD